ncbi:unnamed protein product [marine sediment metagenome]|uniref:ADP ribosyltransferase domain-containing protein n=1 Tax=marine sediment metagenome TaxID=412755 RepID=X1SY44_9ZZZZ
MGKFTSDEYYRYVRMYQNKGTIGLEKLLKGEGFSVKKIERMVRDTEIYTKSMEKYITFSPKYLDKPVYRGIFIEKEEIKGIFKKGLTQDTLGTSSWTSTLRQAQEKGNVIFKIMKNKVGTSIRHMSKWTIENEIIFSKNIKFKILKAPKQIGEEWSWIVEVMEV